jgi:hypothetical protein
MHKVPPDIAVIKVVLEQRQYLEEERRISWLLLGALRERQWLASKAQTSIEQSMRSL